MSSPRGMLSPSDSRIPWRHRPSSRRAQRPTPAVFPVVVSNHLSSSSVFDTYLSLVLATVWKEGRTETDGP